MGGFGGHAGAALGRPGGVEGLLASLQAPLTDVSRPDSIPGTLASVNRPAAELVPRLAGLTTASILLQHVQQEVGSISGKAGKTLESVNATFKDNNPGCNALSTNSTPR